MFVGQVLVVIEAAKQFHPAAQTKTAEVVAVVVVIGAQGGVFIAQAGRHIARAQHVGRRDVQATHGADAGNTQALGQRGLARPQQQAGHRQQGREFFHADTRSGYKKPR